VVLELMSDGPSPETFAQISALLPKFKREATGGKVITPNGVPKKACLICLEFYGSPFKTDKQQLCPKCRKNLKDGFCAFVTLDGTRHLFFRHEKMPKEWAGQTFRIPGDRMGVMEKRFEEIRPK
jgi:hypothetical protein